MSSRMQAKAAWCLNKAHKVQNVPQCNVPRCVPGICLQGQNMENTPQNPKAPPLPKWSCWNKGSSWSACLILSISKEAKPKISQGNLFPEFFPTTVKVFLCSRWTPFISDGALCPLILLLGTRNLLGSSSTRNSYTWIRSPWAEQSQLSQPLLSDAPNPYPS